MTNAQTERQYFWSKYQEILMENGEPFSLKINRDRDGSLRHYAYVNAERFPTNRCICIEFTPQCGRVRYGIYLEKDIELFDILFSYKDKIEEQLGFSCHWEHGAKGPNARRIYCEQEITPCDHDSYLDAIEKSMVRLIKFAEVFEKSI